MRSAISFFVVPLFILLAAACSAGGEKLARTSLPAGESTAATGLPPPSAPTDPPATMIPTLPPPTSTPTADWQLVWSDEFDGADGSPVDAQKWSFDTGGGGWGNAELECYTGSTDNAFLEQGSLVIRAIQQADPKCPYTSARLVTRGKADWLYGRFEVRARLPAGQGIWPAVWMLPTSRTYGDWPRSGEIDIVELVGKEPSRVYGTLHFGAPHQSRSGQFDLPQGTFDQDFHIFAFEWEPGEMRWYVDGFLYQTQNEWSTSSSKGKYPAPFNQRFHMLINLAVGGKWPGNPDGTTTFPKELRIDYVRVYQSNE